MSPRTPDEVGIELLTHAHAGRAEDMAALIEEMTLPEALAVLVEVLGVAATLLTDADVQEPGSGELLLQRAAADYLAAGLTT